jgi:hypothetical protein
MNKRLPDILENCLLRMGQGESLDAVLARHPDLAAQLRPLLETAARARSGRPKDLPGKVLARQRTQLLTRAADLRQGKNRRMLQKPSWRPVWTLLSVLAMLIMSSNGLLIASAHSLPGDTLYPLKRSVESTQLQLIFNPVKRQALEQAFSERRLDETKSLITRQRVESVDFTGVVTNQSDGEWLVSGIPVVLDTQTGLDAGIEVGDEIEVHGATNGSGDVDATRLSLAATPVLEETQPGWLSTQTASPEAEHPEGSPTLTSSPEEGHPEISPVQTPTPEAGHLEDSPTQTTSSEGSHPEGSVTQTPSSKEHQPEGTPIHTPSSD